MVPLEALIPHLVSKGLLSAHAVVTGGARVREVSSRNFDAAIEVSSEPCLFVKQAAGRVGRNLLAAEAAWYEQLNVLVENAAPTMRFWDPANSMLVVDMVPGLDMRQAADWVCRDTAVAVAVAQTLSRLHTAQVSSHEAEATIPGALFLHEPGLELLRDGSAAAIELVRLIQQEYALADALSTLRAELQVVGLIHHDLKWDNIVVQSSGAAPAVARIVDWEIAGVGDPAWDVGTFLAGYLSSWIFSLPSTGATTADRSAELAGRPLQYMRGAIGAFWREYLSGTQDVSWSQNGTFALRAVRCAAARLVQTAYEASQFSDRLTSPVVLHLQVAANILAQPRTAASSLLGIRDISLATIGV